MHDFKKDTSLDDRKDRNTKEVEAESVAFTVCKHFGIDTDDHPATYPNEYSDVSIPKCASQMIGRLEVSLIQFEKDKDKGIKHKLAQSKEKVNKQPIKSIERRGKANGEALV